MENVGDDDQKKILASVEEFHKIAMRMESHDLGANSETAAFRFAAGMLIAVADDAHGSSDLQVRDIDMNHVFSLVPSFASNGIMKGSNLLVRQRIVEVTAEEWTRVSNEYGSFHALPKQDDEPYLVRYGDVFDGNHRVKTFQLLCEAVLWAISQNMETATVHGPEPTVVPATVFSNFSLTKTFSCIVYKERCASMDCITYATALNDLVELAKSKSLTNFLRYLSTYANIAILTGEAADVDENGGPLSPAKAPMRGSATMTSLNKARAALREKLAETAKQVVAQLRASELAAKAKNMLEAGDELKFEESRVKAQLSLVGFLTQTGLRDIEAIASIDVFKMQEHQNQDTPILYKWNTQAVVKPSFSRYPKSHGEKALYAQVAKMNLINEFLIPTKKDSRVARDCFVAFFLAFAASRFFSTSKSITAAPEGDLAKDTLAGIMRFSPKPSVEEATPISGRKKPKGMALFTTAVVLPPHVATFYEDIDVIATLCHEQLVAKAAQGEKTPKIEISHLLRGSDFALMVLFLALPLCMKENKETAALESVWNADGCRSEASKLIDAFHAANPTLPSSVAGKTLKGKKSKVTQREEEARQAQREEDARRAESLRKQELEEQRRQSKADAEIRALKENLKSEQMARKESAAREVDREAQQLARAAAAVKAGPGAIITSQAPTSRESCIWEHTLKPKKSPAYSDDEWKGMQAHFAEIKDEIGTPRLTLLDYTSFGNDPNSFPTHWQQEITGAFAARSGSSVCVRVTPGAFGKALGGILDCPYPDLDDVYVAPPYHIGTTLQSLTLDASDGSGAFKDSVEKFLWEGHKDTPGTLDSIIIVLFKTEAAFLSDQKKWAVQTRGIATAGEHARTHKTGGDGKEWSVCK